jgi:signal transduction histidine kinase
MPSFKNISVNYTESEPITIFADTNMLNTILRNLISNAIKFTNEGGSVNISAQQTDSGTTITVSDNGVGIAPEMLQKLFDNKVAYSTTGTAREKGTGLGLLICKEFVDKHGGKIWVESQFNKGSEFKFTLPLNETLST